MWEPLSDRRTVIGISPSAVAERSELGPEVEAIAVGAVAVLAMAQPGLKARLTGWAEDEAVRARRCAAACEAAVAAGPFLPLDRPAHGLSTDQITSLFKRYTDDLAEALERYGSLVRYDLFARWDVDRVVAEIEARGGLPRALRLPDGPLRAAHQHDVATALEEKLKDRRAQIARRLDLALEEAGLQRSPLKARAPATAAAATVILRRSEAGALDALVRRFEAEEEVAFHCEGPQPCPSAASLALYDASPRRLQQAARRLGLEGAPTRGDLKAAYYGALKTHHPDLRGGGQPDTELIAKLHDAYETLIAFADHLGASAPSDLVPLAAAGRHPRRALRLHIGEDGRRLFAADTQRAA